MQLVLRPHEAVLVGSVLVGSVLVGSVLVGSVLVGSALVGGRGGRRGARPSQVGRDGQGADDGVLAGTGADDEDPHGW
ncbi:MAG: hypothetical protein H5T83_03475 [Actinotalea sp.]|nr:hypothetical protein [Actinotalea sp.]